MSFRLSNR
jgi:hypothetical protein